MPRHLRDPNRTTKLISRFAPNYDPADISQRLVDDVPRFLNAEPDGLKRTHRLRLQILGRRRTLDAEDSDAANVAENILLLLQRRRGLQRFDCAVTPNGDFKRLAGAFAHDA